MINKAKLQLLFLPDPASLEGYRQPPRKGEAVLYTSLAIIKAQVPFLSEAKIINFLGFWSGEMVPLFNASIHFLAGTGTELPTEAEMMYINRNHIQGYL